MNVLLVAGLGVLGAGLVTVVFGIPIKEFSFGDTLIVSGAVVSCTGLMMVSLSVVVRELRKVADQFGSGDRLGPRAIAVREGGVHVGDVRVPMPPGRPVEDSPPPLSDGDRIATNPGREPGAAPSVLSQRRQGQAFDHDRVTIVPVPDAEFPASSDAPSPPKPRRNLLFASMMKERGQVIAERPGPAGLFAPAIHTSDSEAPKPASRAHQSSDAPDHNAQATVLRSGVVNGMAYSLYSDGAIDARLPEGVMRFASIDQLRAHLDQGSARSSPK